MRLSSSFAVFACALSLASATPIKRSIDQATYDDLVFYFKYASSAYSSACASPNGNTLIEEFSDFSTDTQGFVARDDSRKEIVVSLRGSSSVTDFLTDVEIALTPMNIVGVNPPGDTHVHFGFQTAWNSVAAGVLSTVKAQLAAHPGYTLVSSGHSLGGALSSLVGITLQQNFPGTTTRMYTYGQPRTGDPNYAAFVNSNFGDNAFRSVHTFDGVPTLIPEAIGYKHHAFEYWQNPDPASASTTKKCNSSGEDPTCSNSIPSTGINAAHVTYFGISSSTAFCS
ncbi:alpha/beta-hydrolase [Amylostereum chailletii]|nr:alpha/beta-hydrolase [Amylostereum chailletii]